MEVRPQRVLRAGALGAVRRVVAEAADHAAEGRLTLRQVRAAAVVLEAHHLPGIRREHHVADAAVGERAGMAGLEVEDADAGDAAAFVVDVTVAEELEAAADGQHWHAVIDRLVKGRTFGLEVVGNAALLAVLPPADVKEVERGGVEVVAHGDVDHFEVDAACGAAVAEGDDVAAVAVDVHDVWVEVGEAERVAGRGGGGHGSRVTGGQILDCGFWIEGDGLSPPGPFSSEAGEGETASRVCGRIADAGRDRVTLRAQVPRLPVVIERDCCGLPGVDAGALLLGAAGGGGTERRARAIQRRVSAGSMTSSISKTVAMLTALPRS